MKRQILILFTMLMVISISACAPTATSVPTEAALPIAEEPRYTSYPTAAPRPLVEQPRIISPTPVPPTIYEYAPTAAYIVPTIAVPAPNNGMENYFQDYGVNPFTSTDRDSLSTFALDVDTASYEITRSYIYNGAIPPMDAVRAEEFINAFNQGYAAPRDAAFTLYADGAPSPFIQSDHVLIRFGVQGYRVSDYERKSLNLTFVVDVSGSMGSENRLELVKDALRQLVGRLDERDMVTIVAYSDDAWLVLQPTNASDSYRINRAIDQLYPTNSTNADAGLRLGYQYAYRNLNTEAVNRVILCSDGVANTGNIDPETILSFVQGYVDSGITLTGIGVGMGNYNDVLLEKLADRGDGNYYYVNSGEEAHEVFVEKLTSTMQVIAYDAKIQIEFDPQVVSAYRLIGYENRNVADQDFRNDSVDAGEIGAGMSAVALYEVELRDRKQGRIATAKLRWQDADTREVIEINGDFYTYDLANKFEATSPYFQLTSTVAAYAEILRASPYVEGSLDDIASQARRVSNLFEESEQAREFADLAERTAYLNRYEW